MHELALCRAIADTVAEHSQGQRVERVNLTIGHFRQVVPDTLQFCWDIRTKDTALEGSALAITSVAAAISCGDCGTETELSHPILRCGACDSPNITMIAGDEFLIESIDLAGPLADLTQEAR